MQLLKEIRTQDIDSASPKVDTSGFTHRRAARAVVVDKSGRIALLYVGAHAYHKLPGGGIEDNEDIAQALARELIEEIGCTATIISEIGKIVEYRDQWRQKQTSYCYIARQVGKQQQPDFTEKELSQGFEMVWVDTIDAAIALLQNDTPEDIGGKFIKLRDITFLQAAKSSNLHPN